MVSWMDGEKEGRKILKKILVKNENIKLENGSQI